MTTRALPAALLAGATALASAPAAALENPKPCRDAEPRVRCAAFQHGEAYRIIVPPGDSVTVVTAPGSEVLTVAGARVAQKVENQPAPTEWQVTYEGNLAYFTPLEEDIPTSSATLTVKMPDGSLLPHVLELNTRAGKVNLLPASASQAERDKHNADTMFMLTFRYPEWEAAKAAAERRERARQQAPMIAEARRQQEQAFAADRLKQDVFYGSSGRRVEFIWRCQNPEPKPCGNTAIRPLRMSTNGLQTAVQFNTAAPLPLPYTVAQDGKDGELIEFHMAAPDLMVLHAAPLLVRFRQQGGENLVGDALDWNWRADPDANPQTGTTSPGVVRTLRATAPTRPSPQAAAGPATGGPN